MTTKSLGKMVRVGHATMARAIKLLLDEPSTAEEIAEHTGLHKQTVYELMRAMRKQGAAHISAWDVDTRGRDAIAVFSLGPGRDKKRRALSRAEIAVRYRDRRRMKALNLASPVSS